MSISEKLTTIAENEQKVYDAGKKAEWSDFWDELQSNGKRTGYGYRFRGWTDAMFYPKYDLNVVDNCTYMFYSTSIKNLKQRLIECGVELDLSQATGSGLFAYNYVLEELPILDLSNFQNDATNMFTNCKVLHTIDKVILGSNNPNANYTNWFAGCTALKNILIGAETKGERCSDLITVPFNEAFENVTYREDFKDWVGKLKDSFVSEYADYIDIAYKETIICFENGESKWYGEYDSYDYIMLPSWFVPENVTDNVSFYLCPQSQAQDKFSKESISLHIDFKSCPLSRKSIGSVISALSGSASDKTLTLKKSAVNEAFGIDVDNEDSWTLEFELLRDSKDNWTIAYV